jgi:hypothetical protein
MHPFRKLREAGPMTPAQVAVVLNRDVVMHTPLLIKPLVGRELVAIVIAMSTQSRDDPGAYVLEDYPPPMARHGRRTQAREPGAPDRRRERTAAGAHGRIPAVSGSQNIEKSADGSERRQAAGRLVGLSGGNRKVIRSATLAAAQFDVRVGDLHERKSLLPAPRPSPGGGRSADLARAAGGRVADQAHGRLLPQQRRRRQSARFRRHPAQPLVAGPAAGGPKEPS